MTPLTTFTATMAPASSPAVAVPSAHVTTSYVARSCLSIQSSLYSNLPVSEPATSASVYLVETYVDSCPGGPALGLQAVDGAPGCNSLRNRELPRDRSFDIPGSVSLSL